MQLIKNDISNSFRTFSFGAPVTTGAPSFGICSELNSFFDNLLKQMESYNDDTNKTIGINITLYKVSLLLYRKKLAREIPRPPFFNIYLQMPYYPLLLLLQKIH
ncbi:hypothetical protein DSECCO2_199710 [anaerobic digester metagenome]